MKINNIGYLLKEGIRGIFLHGFMSFAAVCVTVACLVIVGTFSSLMYNINLIVEDLNKTNEVIVYVDDTLSDAEARSVGTQINRIENVYEAVPISREEALEKFAEDHKDSSAFNGVDASFLRHRFKVTLMDNRLMDQTITELRAIDGVADISAQYELAKGFSAMQDILRVATVLITGVLLIVSLLIISNTVKLAMYDRRDEIAVMKMVGATNGFIRLPFVVEGFVLGMLGAGLAFGLEWVMYDAMATRLQTVEVLKNLFKLVPFRQMVWPMVATFSAAGVFVGIVGSWTSIRKFMDV